MSGRCSNGLNATGTMSTSTVQTLPTFKSSRDAMTIGRRQPKPLPSHASRATKPVSTMTDQSAVDSSRQVSKARPIRRRLTRGSSQTGRTPSILARLCVRSLAGRRNHARRLKASCSNALVVVSPANRADNGGGVSFRLHVVAYEVPECESLTGGSYGHLPPKRDAESSRRGGVSAGGPACGQRCD